MTGAASTHRWRQAAVANVCYRGGKLGELTQLMDGRNGSDLDGMDWMEWK